ncbi:HAD family hydrolase [Mesobacillus maritimus]|uniref:HAD family hydrolase n=1 Tax=Mesobacillus maritimus TaxID=1643336 RepID=UPI003850A1CE
MKPYKVLFLDIDGTILRPDHTLEDSTKRAIHIVQEQGIETVLATGRPIHEITALGDKLNIQSYIGYNGALALYKGEKIIAEPMSVKNVEYILEVAAQNNHDVVLYSNTTNFFTSLEGPRVKKFIETFDLQNNEIFTKESIANILGITIMTNSENDDTIYSLEDGIHFSQVHVNGMRNCFDVIRDKVNKGVSIQFLLNHLNISKESAIAFGDGMNDKEMLSTVGEGFAMGNAHEDLFQYAKHKTTSVTESGVYNGLKSLGLLD